MPLAVRQWCLIAALVSNYKEVLCSQSFYCAMCKYVTICNVLWFLYFWCNYNNFDVTIITLPLILYLFLPVLFVWVPATCTWCFLVLMPTWCVYLTFPRSCPFCVVVLFFVLVAYVELSAFFLISGGQSCHETCSQCSLASGRCCSRFCARKNNMCSFSEVSWWCIWTRYCPKSSAIVWANISNANIRY